MVIETDKGFCWGRLYEEDEYIDLFICESKQFYITRELAEKDVHFAINMSKDNLRLYSDCIIPYPVVARRKHK